MYWLEIQKTFRNKSGTDDIVKTYHFDFDDKEAAKRFVKMLDSYEHVRICCTAFHKNDAWVKYRLVEEV